MAKDELILSKKDFDRFIRLNYEPDDGTGDKGFFDILMGFQESQLIHPQ